MPRSSIGGIALATELTIDKTGGAVTVKFADMTDEELQRRLRAFPEAREEYAKRALKRLP